MDLKTGRMRSNDHVHIRARDGESPYSTQNKQETNSQGKKHKERKSKRGRERERREKRNHPETQTATRSQGGPRSRRRKRGGRGGGGGGGGERREEEGWEPTQLGYEDKSVETVGRRRSWVTSGDLEASSPSPPPSTNRTRNDGQAAQIIINALIPSFLSLFLWTWNRKRKKKKWPENHFFKMQWVISVQLALTVAVLITAAMPATLSANLSGLRGYDGYILRKDQQKTRSLVG